MIDDLANDKKRARWPSAIAGIALGCLVAAVFYPIVGFEFIDYDVSVSVVRNPHIRGLTLDNIKHIFTSRCVTSYYPVRTLTYAIDYQLWGLDPGGFKLTGGLIHLANAILLYWLIARMLREPAAGGMGGRPWWGALVAGFSAGLFAIHPVVVEPVVWVAGREELLMTLGALGCLHLHITARRLSEVGGSAWRVAACQLGAAVCCAAACLSNAVGAITPALVVAWDLLALPRPTVRRMLAGTAPLWAIAAATLVVKRLGEPSVLLGEPAVLTAKRAMLVLAVYGRNLKAIFAPSDLAFFYTAEIPESFSEPGVLWGGLGIVLTIATCWAARRHRVVLLGLVWFLLALAPTSQGMPHHIHSADRYLYLPLAGLVVAAAMGLAVLFSRVKSLVLKTAIAAAGVAILGSAATAGANQVWTWRSNVTVWENCLRVDPGNSLAHAALADSLAARGDLKGAAEHRDAQMRLDFDNEEVMRLAAIWASENPERPPDHALAIRFATRACELSGWENPQSLQTLAAVYSRHGAFLVESGRPGRAVEEYAKALQADPNCQAAMFQLAVILATCNDEKVRRPEEAVRLAERACDLTANPDYRGLAILAVAYAEALQFDAAVATAEKVVRLARSAGDPAMAADFEKRLGYYRRRVPPQVLRE